MLAPIQATPGASPAVRTEQAQMTMIGHVTNPSATFSLSILTWTLATTAVATTAAS